MAQALVAAAPDVGLPACPGCLEWCPDSDGQCPVCNGSLGSQARRPPRPDTVSTPSHRNPDTNRKVMVRHARSLLNRIRLITKQRSHP